MNYTLQEIVNGVKGVIAKNSRYSAGEIFLKDSLDKFISSFVADRLAAQITRKFDQVDAKDLYDNLYGSIKKVKQLTDYVARVYDVELNYDEISEENQNYII